MTSLLGTEETTSSGGGITVTPLTPTIGAEIGGIDLREEQPDEAIAAVRAALLRHKVVFFRDQDLTVEQHIEFARRFGPLEIHPATPKDAVNPEILRIAHGPDNRGQENNWHSDVTWRECPSLGSLLRAVEVPRWGGDTMFADMEAAYDMLSPGMQEWLPRLTASHDIARVFASKLNRSAEELHEHFPVQHHPIVRTHPETGRRSLYVNVGFVSHVDGLSATESAWLLDHLYKLARVPELQVRFHWEPNSIAFWDNRSCQHYAVSDYYPDVRIMERVTVAGDRPYFDPDRIPDPL